METRGWNTKTDNPKLEVKMLADGRGSLYLLYNFGYNGAIGKSERKKEFLKLYIIGTPRTPVERQQNKETLALAKKIKEERGQQYLDDKEGYRLKQRDVNLFDYFANFIENSNVEDKHVLEGALRNFKNFIKEEYPQFANRIEAKNLNREMMQRFAHYIEDIHKGEGIRTYWQRFKRLINYAVDHKVIRVSPCLGIKIMATNDILAKDILSGEEIKKLFATHYDKESDTIRRAFALTCFTGIRHCDLKHLTYGDIDYANKIMTFRQSKVQHDSKVSGVVIPLNDTLLSIIGKRPEGAKDSDKVVSELLGHSSLKFTQKYLRALDDQKKAAINSLPTIDVNNI